MIRPIAPNPITVGKRSTTAQWSLMATARYVDAANAYMDELESQLPLSPVSEIREKIDEGRVLVRQAQVGNQGAAFYVAGIGQIFADLLALLPPKLKEGSE